MRLAEQPDVHSGYQYARGLLHAGQHFLSVGARVDPGKDMGNDAVFIDNVGDPAGKTSIPGAIRLAQDMVRVAQQREGKASVGGEGAVVFDRVKTSPENLHMALRESIMEVTEPAPFGSSAPGVGFGIKPQHDFLAAQICQAHGRTIVRGDGKIRCRCPDCLSGCEP